MKALCRTGKFTGDGGTHRPFTRYGVIAHQNQGFRKEPPGNPYRRGGRWGKLQWTFGLIIDPHQAHLGVTNRAVDEFPVKAHLPKDCLTRLIDNDVPAMCPERSAWRSSRVNRAAKSLEPSG